MEITQFAIGRNIDYLEAALNKQKGFYRKCVSGAGFGLIHQVSVYLEQVLQGSGTHSAQTTSLLQLVLQVNFRQIVG